MRSVHIIGILKNDTIYEDVFLICREEFAYNEDRKCCVVCHDTTSSLRDFGSSALHG